MTHGTMSRWSAVFALALVAGLAARSDGSYTVTTATTGVTYSGGALSSNTLTAGQVIPIDSGTFTVGAAGGMSYTDAAGTTLYLVNDSRSAGTRAIPNEQIFVANTTSGALDTGTFTFSTNITVLNSGALGVFSEGSSTIQLNLANGDSNYLVTSGTITPPSQTIGGLLFVSSNPQGLSGDINSLNNGGVSAVISAVVPEPASVAMLGLGIVGVAGVMVRRQRSTN